MPQTILIDRFNLLSPEYQEILTSDFPQASAQIFAEMLSLDVRKTTILENGFVLYLLFFLDRDGFTHFLITNCDVTPKQAEDVTKIIIDDLPPRFIEAQHEAYTNFTKSDSSDQLLNDTNRVKVLKGTPLYKVRFYQYLQKQEAVESLTSKYLKNPEQESDFITLLGDLALGFYKVEDTVPLLQQELGLDPRTAALLGADVIEFLAPLKDPNWQPPQAEIAARETTATSTSIFAGTPVPIKSATPIPQQTTTPTEPAAPPHTPVYTPLSIPNSYTPNPEPVYQSSQPSNLSNIPSYMPPSVPVPPPAPQTPAHDRPRWSSDI
jgi:hypothetical protein